MEAGRHGGPSPSQDGARTQPWRHSTPMKLSIRARRNEHLVRLRSQGESVQVLAFLTGLSPRQVERIAPAPEPADADPDPGGSPRPRARPQPPRRVEGLLLTRRDCRRNGHRIYCSYGHDSIRS